MSEPAEMIGLSELRHCYRKLGRFSKARLYVATYSDGRRVVVYPVPTNGAGVVWAEVGSA